MFAHTIYLLLTRKVIRSLSNSVFNCKTFSSNPDIKIHIPWCAYEVRSEIFDLGLRGVAFDFFLPYMSIHSLFPPILATNPANRDLNNATTANGTPFAH